MRDELLKLHRTDFGPEEEAEVLAALRSGWVTKGPRTAEFQERFAARVAAPQALGLNSCTAALHTALLAAGIGPGDEVIVPALTFAASANVVVHCGATPVFADVLPDTHCIDPAHAASLITPRTRAITPVHFGGMPCALDALYALADRHGLFLLDDCAHAIETEWRGTAVGVASGSRFAAYSFYATKNLSTGEGGMLTFRDAADVAPAQVASLHGMSADAWKRYSGQGFKLYDIVAAGFKYNMFDLQAALGLVQLGKLDANWQRRRARAEQYAALLADVPGVSLPQCPAEGKHAHHLLLVRLDPEWLAAADRQSAVRGPQSAVDHGAPFVDADNGRRTADGPNSSPPRDAVIHALRARNVEAYVHYIALTGTQFYRERYGADVAQTPVAHSLARRSITLPLFPTMTEEDVQYVVAMLKESMEEVAGSHKADSSTWQAPLAN
jgi:dTDP-4-amino-4,6-dideoxygalactose transaminase